MTIERNHTEEYGQNKVLLTARDLKVEYGMRTVFKDLSFSIREREKLALTGPNGAGKTTLVKLIVGTLTPGSGEICKKKNIRMSYVPQSADDVNIDGDMNVERYIARSSGLLDIQTEIQNMYTSLEKRNSDRTSMDRLGDLQTRFENLGGYRITSKVQKILAGMGLSGLGLGCKFGTLSGGERMKVFIGVALATDPDILILDEPTNNIDKKALDWLGDFLASYNRSVLAVSHDSDFLDKFVEKVIEIVPEKARVVEYTGNYSTFLKKKGQSESVAIRGHEKLVDKMRKAEQVGDRLRAGSQSGVGRSRLTFAAKLEDEIQKRGGEFGKSRRELNMNFGVENSGPKKVMVASNIIVRLGDKEIDFSALNIEIKRGERWQIRGGTGTGKSALLGAIMGDVKVERGTLLISDKINIGHFSERHEDFKPDNSLIDEIHEVNGSLSHDRIRSILGHFLFTGDDQLKRVRVLSQGERSRLALAKLVIGNHNFLVIDEPTSHLDMKARGRLAEALKNYNGTLMLVSKDEDFVSDVGITHRLNLPKCEVSLFQG